MTLINQRLTDRQRVNEFTDKALIHIVEPEDITQDPSGSSYSIRVSDVLGEFSTPADVVEVKYTVVDEEAGGLDDITSSEVLTWFGTQLLDANKIWLVRVTDDDFFDTYLITDGGSGCEVVARYRGGGSGLAPSAEIEIQYASYPEFAGMDLYSIDAMTIDTFISTYYPNLINEVLIANVKVFHSSSLTDKFKQFQVFKDGDGMQKVVELTSVLDKAEYQLSGDTSIAYPYHVETVNGRIINVASGLFELAINPSIDCRLKVLFSQAGDLIIGEGVTVTGDISGTDTTIAIDEGSFFEVFSYNGDWCFKRIGGDLAIGYKYDLLDEYPVVWEAGQLYVGNVEENYCEITMHGTTKTGLDLSPFFKTIKIGDIFRYVDASGQEIIGEIVNSYFNEITGVFEAYIGGGGSWAKYNFDEFIPANIDCSIWIQPIYTPESNDIVTINEEFATDPTLKGIALNSATASPAATSYIDESHFGCFQINKGSNDNAGYGYGTLLGSLQVANGLKFYDIVRTTTLTSVFWLGGFMNVQANSSNPAIPTPTQGAYYEMNDGVITFKLISGANTATAPTTFTMSANTWYLIYLEVEGDTVRFELRDMSGDVLYSWHPSASSAVPMGQKVSAQAQFFCTTNSTAPPQVAVIDKFKVVTPEMGRNLPF